MHFREQLAELAEEIKHVMDNGDMEKEFYTKKSNVLEILQLVYGENSRVFRVTKLTSSPRTIVKILNHITSKPSNLFYSLSNNTTAAAR